MRSTNNPISISKPPPPSASGSNGISLTSGAGDPPPALIQGRVDAAPDATEVLVAVDGTIVTGSKVYPIEGGSGFLALLPSAFVGESLRLEFVVVTADGRLLTPALSSL